MVKNKKIKKKAELSDETKQEYELYKKQLLILSITVKKKKRTELYTNFKFVYHYQYVNNILVDVKVTNYSDFNKIKQK